MKCAEATPILSLSPNARHSLGSKLRDGHQCSHKLGLEGTRSSLSGVHSSKALLQVRAVYIAQLGEPKNYGKWLHGQCEYTQDGDTTARSVAAVVITHTILQLHQCGLRHRSRNSCRASDLWIIPRCPLCPQVHRHRLLCLH